MRIPRPGISVVAMTERLARHAALHPKRMLAIWGAIFVLSIAAIAVLLPSALTTDATVTNDPESQQGYDAMFRHLPPSDDFVNEVVLVRAPGKDVTTDRQAQLQIEQLAAALQATGRTAQVRSYFDDEDPGLLSPDKDAVVDHDRDGPGCRGRDQGRDRRRPAGRPGAARGGDHGRVHGRRRLPHALEQGSEGRRALLRASGGADRASARLRRRRRRADPGPARDRRDHLRARARRRRRPGLGGLLLRGQHAHGDGARARRRLRPLHRQPLPRGATGEGHRRSRRSGRPAGPPAAPCSSAGRRS